MNALWLAAKIKSIAEIIGNLPDAIHLIDAADELARLHGLGEITITTNDAGDCVAVTRNDADGRILSVIWERG